MHLPALLAALAVTGIALTGCGADSSAAASSGKVQVLAVENTWGDIARQIGGDRVTVRSILTDPNADPHAYESDPRAAAAVGSARLVVENGLGYDDFADKLLKGATVSGRRVVDIAQVVHASGNANPHLWYSPTYVEAGARAIAQQLTTLDPAGTSAYAAGLAGFLRGYRSYPDVLETIRARYAGAAVAYTERVPGYLLDAAGLTLGAPASFARSIEDGNDPSPGDTDALDRALTDHRVRVLLYNAQVTSPVTERVKALAQSSGVPVVGVAETIPRAGEDFQTWQTEQAEAVLAALGGAA